MLHQIPIEKLGPCGEEMARAVQNCVHCGFCLPSCPTYQVLGQEMDSPRGRIYLMKEALEEKIPLEQVLKHVDRCLGCLGCETACPSGVQYHQLLQPFRQKAERERKKSRFSSLRQKSLLALLSHPGRFRLAMRLGRPVRRFRKWMPAGLRRMLDFVPETIHAHQSLQTHIPAQGQQRARVAVLSGCVQQVIDPDIHLATVEVLARNGVEVLVPASQGCCGALAWHQGHEAAARQTARLALKALDTDVDAVITHAAGCGSALHEYPAMFRGQPEEAAARRLAEKAVDASVFLDRLGLLPVPALKTPLRVAYHDACHLAHAQQVRSEPRRLLRAIPGLEILEVPDGSVCCGSAGTYNIDQPEVAWSLGQKKSGNIRSISPDLVACGNIGCMVQIRTHLEAGMAQAIPVRHTLQVLRDAYRQGDADESRS